MVQLPEAAKPADGGPKPDEELVVIQNVLIGRQHRERTNDKCVLFVHGLTGEISGTWKESSSTDGFMELLFHDPELQDFDVFAFGYRSQFFRGASINNAAIQLANAIQELVQNRPYQIVLLAHSMGGLVCMRYIVDQLARGRIPPAIGLILYATPTTGSDLLKAAMLVGSVVGMKIPLVRWLLSLFSKTQRQIEELKTGSEFLTNLHAEWAFRVVNGGHESARSDRMWLPVRVVTAEDDLFVTEASAKGLYGAIDWLPLSYGHVALVKPVDRNNDRYVAAKSFLRICRDAPNREILDRIWQASNQVWSSRNTRVSNSLRFSTVIENKKLPEIANLAGFTSCRTFCQYEVILEDIVADGNAIEIGITISDEGSRHVWSRNPKPVYVHQIGLEFLPKNEREELQSSLNKVLVMKAEDAWSLFFPKMSITMDKQPLSEDNILYQDLGLQYSNWLVRRFLMPASFDRKKFKVDLKVEYDSIVPLALAHFVFSAPWIINSVADLRIVVLGDFEYFVPMWRLIPQAPSSPRTVSSAGRQELVFSHDGIIASWINRRGALETTYNSLRSKGDGSQMNGYGTGTILQFNQALGVGVIRPDDGSAQVFFTSTVIERGLAFEPTIGQLVDFDLVEFAGIRFASSVRKR
jgi:cold shock CspA family protein/pimeloyl-ACP methyl ester carboxylesterase